MCEAADHRLTVATEDQTGTGDSTAQEPRARYRDAYSAMLTDAIRVLTDAARLPRPRRRRASDGAWVDDPDSGPELMDWAEFVTLALAGAAANLGGVDAALAGRPGSWEADGLRQLLYSTVGADETDLWTHRTDPVEITLYVDELLADRTEAWAAYDQARTELNDRYTALADDWDESHDSRHMWIYDRTSSGEMVPRDPAAPAWSWDTWRAGLDDEMTAELRAAIEDSLRTGIGLFTGRVGDTTTAYIEKSPEDGVEHRRLLDAHDEQLNVIADLEERLEEQRLREWTAYGETLQAHLRRLASAIPDLHAPVHLSINTETLRTDDDQRKPSNSLEGRLVDAAIAITQTPDNLPRGPIERLVPNSDCTWDGRRRGRNRRR